MILTPLTPDLLAKRIWRYFRLEHFRWLIENRALWFSSADTFFDQWEGSYTLHDVQHREQLWDEIENPKAARDSVRAIADWNRMATFVNCWSVNEHECALMWQSFVKGDGVAVQSTIERLRKVLPAWVFIVPINYINYDKENPPVFHSLQPFTWKQEEFRAEHELRLMIDVAPPGHPFRHLPIEPKGHREIQIGLHTLIESLVVGPNSAEATVEEVRTLLGRSRLEMPLRVSRLSRLPYH